jgi:arylsulfatase A-like enzyme
MTGFAERLKEAGYTTAFAGKWCVVPPHRFVPTRFF